MAQDLTETKRNVVSCYVRVFRLLWVTAPPLLKRGEKKQILINSGFLLFR